MHTLQTASVALAGLLCASAAHSQVVVSASVGLPVITFTAAPELIVVPGTYVYAVADRDDDFYFYDGYWWRPWAGAWYRAGGYDGPWVVVDALVVPRPLIGVPMGWRAHAVGVERLHWVDVNSHWRQWQQEKRWEKREQREDRRELRHQVKQERREQRGKHHGKKK